MAEQLANFIATHVRRSSTPSRIGGLRLLERQAGQFEDREVVERDAVIELLEDGERIFVWDADAEDLGDELELVRVQGERFLRVDGQRLLADDVGDLPEV